MKTSNLFVQDTNAVMIPARTGYYDLHLNGDDWKYTSGSIQAASLKVTGVKFLGNQKSLELRDSLVVENKGLIQIDSGTTTVGAGINRGSFAYGVSGPISNGILGLISADSGKIVFGGKQLYFIDTMRVRNTGSIQMTKGSVIGEIIHAGKGQIQQTEASLTLYQKLIASKGGIFQLAGSKETNVRDSVWVKKGGLVETTSSSTGDFAVGKRTSMLGGIFQFKWK